jgi:type IV secretory pathway VirB10-like protein
MIAVNTCLSELRRTVIMRAGVVSVALLLLCLFAESAAAQQPEKRNDLDVTMQIIVDPDAKLPDEVVRRIPLPARKSADPASGAEATGKSDKTDKERNDAANEHGKETSEAARDRAREAAEQRESARRAEAEERKKRERGPPDDRPDPPNRPPKN